MSKTENLFGKTFDQQITKENGNIENKDISPNRRVQGEIVFEPVVNGVRVTARDAEHQLLWGFIGSKDIVGQVHSPVAVYETLHTLLAEELGKRNLPKQTAADPMQAAQSALDVLQKAVDDLKASITVKKISDATLERASAIARIANDAARMITLETSSFKGMK